MRKDFIAWFVVALCACKEKPIEVRTCADAAAVFTLTLRAGLEKQKHPAAKIDAIVARARSEVSETCERDEWPPSAFDCLSKLPKGSDMNCPIPKSSETHLAGQMRVIVKQEMERE